nr:hypothetical protein [Leptospira sarikeiensis]
MNDKITHSVYKAISAATSFKNVKKRQLFEPHHRVPEVAELGPKEIDLHLKRLLEDGTVSQLAYLVSDDAEQPKALPCYAAFPETESLDLSRIYLELLDYSVSSLLNYLDRKSETNKSLIWENLESDWEWGARKEAPFPQLFLYLRQSFQNEHFRIPANSEFIKDFLFELEDDLHKKGRVIDVPGYGLFGIRNPKEAVQIMDYIDDFIQSKAAKPLRYVLMEEFQKIAMEEKLYYSNSSNPETSQFKIARAEALAKVLPNGNPSPGTPGMLSIVLLRSLAEIAEKELHRQSSERDRNKFHEIKRNLISEGGSWERKVLLLTDKEFKSHPEELKRMLIDDLEIGYSTWETKTSTIHAFFHKNANSVRQIILSLGASTNAETWKILCIRQLVESNEPQIKSVFKEPDLVKAYGKVLRKGYMDYFPWYYTILDWFGIGRIFQDVFFAQAKDKIRLQQNQLKVRNHETSKKEEQARIQEKIKEEEKIRQADQKSKISSVMDEYYFRKSFPPTASEIQENIPDFSADLYYQILDREKFVFIAWEKGKERMDQLICYPPTESFRNKARELHKVLSEKLEVLQNKVRTPEEEDNRNRISKIIKHVDEWFASHKAAEKGNPNAPKGKSDPEDPFESFKKEIDKLRKVNKS